MTRLVVQTRRGRDGTWRQVETVQVHQDAEDQDVADAYANLLLCVLAGEEPQDVLGKRELSNTPVARYWRKRRSK